MAEIIVAQLCPCEKLTVVMPFTPKLMDYLLGLDEANCHVVGCDACTNFR